MMAQTTQSGPRSRFAGLLPYLLIAPPLAVMALLIVYPAALSIFDTVTTESADGSTRFTLENYISFFQLPDALPNLLFTLRITIITVALLFAVCFPISYYLRFSTSQLSVPVRFLALFPMFVPGIVTAFALIRFLGDNGWIENILFSLTGWEGWVSPIAKPQGIVIGLVWEGVPVTVLVLTAGLSQVPNHLIESARDVGANGRQVFFRIIFPQIRRSVLIVLTLNFLGVFGAFTIPLLLGGASPQMYGHYMANRLYGIGQYTHAQTAAVIMFLISAVVGTLYVRSVVHQRMEKGE